MISKKKKTKKELRNFGIVMAVCFGLLASLLFWKEKQAWRYLASIAVSFLLTGLIVPVVLAPLESIWMKFSILVSKVMTPIIFTIVFFVAFAPFGIVMRLLKIDLLKRKIEPEAETYWNEVKEDSPGSRHFLPY